MNTLPKKAKRSQETDRLRAAYIEENETTRRLETQTEALVRLARVQEEALALYREEVASAREEAKAADSRARLSLMIAAASLALSVIFYVLNIFLK